MPNEVLLPGGLRLRIHLGSEDTGGAFCLVEDHPPDGWSLPPLVHSGGGHGRRLLVFAPAGMERFFLELADGNEPAPALALRYGWRFVASQPE